MVLTYLCVFKKMLTFTCYSENVYFIYMPLFEYPLSVNEVQPT